MSFYCGLSPLELIAHIRKGLNPATKRMRNIEDDFSET